MVRCVDCGFLCVRSHANEFVEVPEDIRRNWGAQQHDNFWKGNKTIPICFARALPEDGRREAQAGPKDSQKVIERERECAFFMEWQQGFTPKEHREMFHEKMLMEMHAQQRERDRDWQESRTRDDRDRQESRIRIDRLWNVGQAVFVVILSAAISWVVSNFAIREKPQPPIHIHIDGTKATEK
jgi:hypothetical protein